MKISTTMILYSVIQTDTYGRHRTTKRFPRRLKNESTPRNRFMPQITPSNIVRAAGMELADIQDLTWTRYQHHQRYPYRNRDLEGAPWTSSRVLEMKPKKSLPPLLQPQNVKIAFCQKHKTRQVWRGPLCLMEPMA